MKKFSIVLMAVVGMLCIYGNVYADLNDGLVAYYPFNGNADDESGNGNDGTVNGASLTTDRFGNANSAYSFDGVDDSISIPDMEWTEITFSIWLKIDDMSNTSIIMEKAIDDRGTYGEIEIDLYYSASVDKFRVNIGRSYNSTSQIQVDIAGISEGEYHLYTLTANRNGNLMLYIDGELLGETVISGSENLSGSFLIGNDLTNAFQLKGDVDEIRIYNRALSDSEIQQLYNGNSTITPKSDPEDGLVAYYPFNGNADDESGNGNDGTEYGNLSYDAGKIGPAASFDGEDAYITLSNIIDIEKQFTFSGWYLLNNKGDSWNAFFNKDIYCDFGMMYLDRDSIIRIFNGTCEGLRSYDYSYDMPLDQWIHYAFSYDGNKMSVFIDGNLAHQFNYSQTIRDNNGEFYLGATNNSSGYPVTYFWEGLIDEVRIYNRALSESEIQQLYVGNTTVDPEPNPENGLIAYYPFDGDADDESGNGNDGTETNISYEQGITGNAAKFDGSNSSNILIPSPSAIDDGSLKDFTVSLYFNASSIDNSILIQKEAPPNNSKETFTIGMSNSVAPDELYGAIESSNGNPYHVYSGEYLSSNQWYHAVMSYDLDTLTLKLYLNGAMVNESTSNEPPGYGLGDMIIGKSYLYNAYNFSGLIDEVRIYNKVLSDSEIQVLYQGGNDTPEPDNIDISSAKYIAPLKGAIDQDITTAIIWEEVTAPQKDMIEYMVYFGKSSTISEGDFQTSTKDIFWSPPYDLDEWTTYYWKIDVKYGEKVILGAISNFKTKATSEFLRCEEGCQTISCPFAVLSKGAYENEHLKIWKDWQSIAVEKDIESGYRANIYKNDILKQVVVAYAGTGDGLDILTDLAQFGGIIPKQYIQAATTALQVIAASNSDAANGHYGDINGYDVWLVGHSLGGGLAQFSASIFEVSGTITFNTATINSHIANVQIPTLKNALKKENFPFIASTSPSVFNVVAVDENGAADLVASQWGLRFGTTFLLPIPGLYAIDFIKKHSIATIVEYLGCDNILLPNAADLWIRNEGGTYGVPQNISGDIYLLNQYGENIKTNRELAGELFAAGFMIDDIRNQSFENLDESLNEVIVASTAASFINEVGEIAEDGLKKLAKTAAQPLLAPATGGASVVNQIGSEIANVLDTLNIDIEEAKFYIGMGLITETKILLSEYQESRENLLKMVNSRSIISYKEIEDIWHKQKVISDIAPFAARMTTDSVTKGDTDQGFWSNFFSGLVDAFNRIVIDTITDLAGGAVKAANATMDLAETALEVEAAIAEMQVLIKSIFSSSNDVFVEGLASFAESHGLTTID